LIYSVYPQIQVFVDGRNNAYAENEPTVFADYKIIEEASLGWEKLLRERQIDIVILEWGLDSVFPPRPYRHVKKFKGLIPILFNPEGIVFLRPRRLGGRPEYLGQIKSYFKKLDISFDEEKGVSPAEVIDKAPEKAVAFKLVPESFFEDVKLTNSYNGDKHTRHLAAMRVAETLLRLQIDQEAENIYLQILKEDERDADSIAGMSMVQHYRADYLQSLNWAERLARIHPRDERGHAMVRHLWNEHGLEIKQAQEKDLSRE